MLNNVLKGADEVSAGLIRMYYPQHNEGIYIIVGHFMFLDKPGVANG